MCMWFSPAERKPLKEIQNINLDSASTSHSAAELGESDFQGKNHKWFYQAPVVQKVDSAIHRINHSPVDKY